MPQSNPPATTSTPAQRQDADENQGFDAAGLARFAYGNGSGKKKQGLHGEDYEQHGDQVKLGRQAQAREICRHNA